MAREQISLFISPTKNFKSKSNIAQNTQNKLLILIEKFTIKREIGKDIWVWSGSHKLFIKESEIIIFRKMLLSIKKMYDYNYFIIIINY